MPSPPLAKPDDRKAFALRLALFYAALFVGFGIHQPFFPLWLKAKGLSESEIGAVLSLALCVRLLATPTVTFLADRAGIISIAIVVCSFATLVAYFGVGLADGFVMILVSVLIAHFVWSPVTPLLDAYGLAGVARRGLDYGRIRVWGSVAFLAANVIAGALVTWLGALSIVWMLWASFVPLAVVSVLLIPDRRDRIEGPKGPGYFNARFVIVMAAVALLQASHGVYYGFSSIHWRSQLGYSGTTVGLLWATAVGAEIAMFWVASRFTRGWRPTTYLILGGLGSALRWGLMAFDPPMVLLMPLQLLHGAGFGLVHLGTMVYLSERVPAHARASGQGTVSIAIGGATAGSTLLAGYFYARVGAGAYLAMVALCAAGIALTAFARSLPRAGLAQPQSEEAGG